MLALSVLIVKEVVTGLSFKEEQEISRVQVLRRKSLIFYMFSI